MKLVFIGLVFFDGCQAVEYPSVELVENGRMENPTRAKSLGIRWKKWTAIKQRLRWAVESVVILHLFLDRAVKQYFISLSSLPRLDYVPMPIAFADFFFGFFSTSCAYPSPIFSVARWNTLWHCEFVAGTLHPCAESSAALLKSGVSCQFNQQWEKSICKSHWVHSNMNDFNHRRKFRSQPSDNMDRWKAEMERVREKRKSRREKSRRERVRRKKMQMCEKVGTSRKVVFFPRASERGVLPISGGLSIIFSSSHLLIFTSSHLLIFASSRLHIFSSSHFLIFTASPLHIFSSSHLLIFTSSPLHIFSSSHRLIFTSSHIHIFSSSHLLIFTSSHIHPLALLPSWSLALLVSWSLGLLPSCPLAFSFLSISLLKAGAVPTRRHEMQPFRTKWGSIAKNWGKIAICKSSRATLSHEMRFDPQKLR